MSGFLLQDYLARGAKRSPGHPALVAPDGTLTYRELDLDSGRLAAVLRRQGIRRGDRVGIDLEKSTQAVVAIFGILKAGATYVPLDPKTPGKRKALVVTDCAMRGLVTTYAKFQALLKDLPSPPPCVVLADPASQDGIPGWDAVLASDAGPPPASEAIELDLAYILYTSGSTGVPKGVMISHRAARSFVEWATGYFGLGSGDRLANHAPLHFDLSVFDLFAALAAGGTTVLVPPAMAVFPRSLAQWMEDSAVTVWYSVPSALTQLVLHGGLERFRYAALRRILFAGETFPGAHLRSLMQRIPGAAYFNLYGPTETNVCTVYAVPGPLPAGDAPVPIGRACANTEVFALADDGRPAQPGETGELLVRGPTLMQGYWGRPDRSAEVLVPCPQHPDRTERAYRTGDLVRQDASGDFHFIGRRDAQVKSRGYRIEPGEVESILHGHPGIAAAAVLPAPHPEFGCLLRAVVVPRAGSQLAQKDVMAFCAAALPAYMIPATIEIRDALPMTANGKVDRRTLLEEIPDA